MANEVLQNIPSDAELVMDWTVGHGWHSWLILSTFPKVNVIAVDRDPDIIQVAKDKLAKRSTRVQFVTDSYKNLDKILGREKVDGILLDLGVNMEHFKDPKRWFSIKYDWPLDMRFDITQPTTALYILKNYTFSQLEDIFQKYGDFHGVMLKQLIKKIISSRHQLSTTFSLKSILKEFGLSEKKIAVVFQVLRIETNKELEQLETFLQTFQDYLKPGGRCLIITYHSIEDRLVKNRFKELDKRGFAHLTKKVIFPTRDEIKKNKAARSAKLRILEKLDN